MDLKDFGTVQEGKMRLVQEMVPGKQVTLAHIIASPDEIIYQKLGLNPNVDYQQAAIGILSMTPSEISVIAGDIATKTSKVEMGFIDRFSGCPCRSGSWGTAHRSADGQSCLRPPCG